MSSYALRFVELLEQAATPSHGSIIDYNNFGSPIYAKEKIPEAQCDQRQEIQSGIKSFHDLAQDNSGYKALESRFKRRLIQSLLARLTLMPLPFEKELFSKWKHDDSFANGACDMIVSERDQILQPYLSPRQLMHYSYEMNYWPQATRSDEVGFLTRQGVGALMLDGNFELFSYPSPVLFQLKAYNGPVVCKCERTTPEINHFAKSLIEFKIDSSQHDMIELLAIGGDESGFDVDYVAFHRCGSDHTGVDSVVILEGQQLGERYWQKNPVPRHDEALEELAAASFDLIIPDEVIRWRSPVHVSFAISVPEQSPVAASACPPGDGHVLGWVDQLFGLGPVIEDRTQIRPEMHQSLISYGWSADFQNNAAPDFASLVLSDDGQELVFPGELYPRPDVVRGFMKPIKGPCGIKSKLRARDLSIGVFDVSWRVNFGDRVECVKAPYRVSCDVDDNQELVMAFEVVGSTVFGTGKC